MSRLNWMSLLMLLWGCDLRSLGSGSYYGGPGVAIEPYNPCKAAVTANLQGLWTLRGHGERQGCKDSRYSGPFSFETTEPLPMVAEVSEDGVHAVFRLEDPKEGFQISGTLSGSCFSAWTSESLPTQTLDFELTANGVNHSRGIQGEIETHGPDGCVGTGTFELNVVPAG